MYQSQSYAAELDELSSDEFEFEFEANNEAARSIGGGGVFNEVTEMELASELLGASDEAELDLFFDKLFKRAAKAVTGAGRAAINFVNSPTGKQLGGLLKNVAAKTLPMALAAAGASQGIPPAVGMQVGNVAGSLLSNLELEGLSPEDREFEVARQIVKLGGDAVANALNLAGKHDPIKAARSALIDAAKVHAPGLIRPLGGGGKSAAPRRGAAESGKWQRVGNTVVLYGL